LKGDEIFLRGKDVFRSCGGGGDVGTDSTELGSRVGLVEVNGGRNNRGDASIAYSLSGDSADTIREASEGKATRGVGGAECQATKTTMMSAGRQEVESRVGGEEGGAVGDGTECAFIIFLI